MKTTQTNITAVEVAELIRLAIETGDQGLANSAFMSYAGRYYDERKGAVRTGKLSRLGIRYRGADVEMVPAVRHQGRVC